MITTFESDRILLRSWRETDLPIFAEMNQCDHVMKFMPSKLTRTESDKLAKELQNHIEQHEWGLWAAELKASNDFIGFVGLHHTEGDAPFQPAIEIGWRLHHHYWGRGYATEAAKKALQIAFNEINLDNIVSFTAKLNLRSQRVMQRIGMNRNPSDDFEHPKLPVNSPLRPHVLYRLSRKAYFAGVI